jgi:hypothetical protein
MARQKERDFARRRDIISRAKESRADAYRKLDNEPGRYAIGLDEAPNIDTFKQEALVRAYGLYKNQANMDDSELSSASRKLQHDLVGYIPAGKNKSHFIKFLEAPNSSKAQKYFADNAGLNDRDEALALIGELINHRRKRYGEEQESYEQALRESKKPGNVVGQHQKEVLDLGRQRVVGIYKEIQELKNMKKEYEKNYDSIVKTLNTGQRTKRGSKLEDTASTFAVVGLVGGLFFLSSNITGNAIANTSQQTTNILGVALLGIGLVAGFFWSRKRK